MSNDSCPQCDKFRDAGLDSCPKCNRTFGTAAATASTLFLRHPSTGETWTLTEGRLVVGRKDASSEARLEPADVRVLLDDTLVSGQHAVIAAVNGSFTIADSKSTDGTHVNEREIAQPTLIEDADKLRFGDTILIASIEASTPAPAALPRRNITLPYTDNSRALIKRASETAPRQVADAERTVLERRPPNLDSAQPSAPKPPLPRVAGRPARPDAATDRARLASVVPAPITNSPVKPRSATPGPGVPTSNAAATSTGLGLSQLVRDADAVAAAIGQFEQRVAEALERFDRDGGQPALESFVAQAQRVKDNPHSVDDLELLIGWMPQACRLLETELVLVNLLSSRGSDAPR